MPRKRVLWQLYPSYLLIMLISLIAVAWYASRSLRQFYFDQTARDLEVRATLVAHQVDNVLADTLALRTAVASLGSSVRTRLTVILPSGKIIADSEESPSAWDTQLENPEFAAARAGRTGYDSRFVKSFDDEVMYVAVPIRKGGSVVAAVRASTPLGFIEDALWDIRIKIGVGALIIGLIAAAISLWVSRRISRPIQELQQGAVRFTAGDFSSRMPVAETEEIGGLAEAMNEMAVQLDDRIRTITRQRNEQDVILASMVEGVIAVDMDERLIIINRAAAQLLGVSPDDARGRTIQEIIRNTDLLRLVTQSLTSRTPVEGDIVLSENGEQFLQAHGTLLRDPVGNSLGAMVVFHDITRVRKLENLRRDFVANVSHELKTPITSIKGFVETLQDGAVEDPEAAKRFLGIITRQVDRLNSIIEDLLALSRIEQDAESQSIPLEAGSICEVLHAGMQACSLKAKEKHMEINLVCDPNLRARINPPLLEQAIVNLIDNAVKYSEPDKRIDICAVSSNREVTIEVRDQGRGIGREHLPRLWERFYRVDTARSRSMGGTGLGLAIVKHIVLAHGGRVSVSSELGVGSVFRIHLPTNQL